MANKVLVVEDEKVLAQNLKAYLEMLHFEVQVAHDGASAIGLTLNQDYVPEVIVLDFRLPDMDGFQLLDAIGRRFDCRCVLITAQPTYEVYDGAVQRGVGYVLFKPFPLAELGRVVSRLMNPDSEEPVVMDGQEKLEVLIERRRKKAASFPLQMYDGNWVLADRRGPVESQAATQDAEEQRLLKEEGSQ